MTSLIPTPQAGKQAPALMICGRNGKPVSDRSIQALSRFGLLEKLQQAAAAELSHREQNTNDAERAA